MNLMLTGFKGCGKTHFGKLLAKRVNASFIDTDQLLEKKFKKSSSSLYERAGKERFLMHEQEVIEELLLKSRRFVGGKDKRTCRDSLSNPGLKARDCDKRSVQTLSSVQNTVIALGGGTLLNKESARLLRTLGSIVYLEEEKERVRNRLLTPPFPAFIDKQFPELSFEKMYDERLPHYEACATKRFFLNGQEEEILNFLEAVFYGK